jgi:hypothetical protein
MHKSVPGNTATGAPSVSPASLTSSVSPDLDQWRRDISDIDALAQSGFAQIRALARLSVGALGSPEPRLEDVADVLHVIWRICEDRVDGIHHLALPMLEGSHA